MYTDFVLLADVPDQGQARAIDLDVDIGADAVDYNAIAKAGQSGKPTPSLNNLLIFVICRIAVWPRGRDAQA